jgi:hypothetical protein
MFAVLMVAVSAKSSSLLKVPDLQKQAKPLNKKTIHYETMLGVPCRSHGAQRRAFSCFFKDFFFKKPAPRYLVASRPYRPLAAFQNRRLRTPQNRKSLNSVSKTNGAAFNP